MARFLFPTIILLSSVLFSCNRKFSFAMVNESRDHIKWSWSRMEDPDNYWHPYFEKIEQKDTLITVLDHKNQTMEIMYVFKDDTCYYQQMNLYCSPCADDIVKKIRKDKRYRFKDIDGVNYISEEQKGVIMRLGSSLKDDTVCSEIKIIRMDEE